MKILYGVAGEGFGHSSRALILAGYLEKQGHEVIILTYGQAYKVLKNKFKCFKVKGLHLIFEKSVLKKRKTIGYNLRNFSKNLLRWKRFHKLMKEFNPELCISDMEPIVPILRNWYKLPLICFDNQHRLTNLKLDIPRKYLADFLIAKGVVESFVKRAEYFVIVSFGKNKVKEKYRKNTFVIPPIVRDNVLSIKKDVEYGGRILVYLTKKDKQRLNVLKKIKENFVVYGYNKNKKKGNLEFKTKEHFLEDLKKCKAIISTAGFTLISEAIYLRKPYLALPLKGQFEQTLNSLFLKQSGFGDFSEDLNGEKIGSFICNLNKYRKNLKKNNPNSDELFKVFGRILADIRNQ
jgi:uncharacterized protein (TIGR00661 family)